MDWGEDDLTGGAIMLIIVEMLKNNVQLRRLEGLKLRTKRIYLCSVWGKWMRAEIQNER